MKAILAKNVNRKGLGMVLGLDTLNPVFESKEEWLNYYKSPSKEQIREAALHNLEKNETEEAKAYYGEEALLASYLKRAENDLYKAYYKKQSDLVNKAEKIEGGYVFLTRENNINIHDTADWNLGLFISKEVASECLDEVIKYHGKTLFGYPIIARDENGNEIDIETEREAE